MEFLLYFSILVALVVAIGETIVLVKTDKYWPLSLDDYLVCVGLLIGAYTLPSTLGLVVLLVSYSAMAGNVYAMLFTRMDPKTGSRERLGLLTAMLIAAIVGCGYTALMFLGGLS